MKYSVCSVLDIVSQQYGRPFFTLNEGSAIRGFTDEVNQPNESSVLYKHPNDFQLFVLGTFDDSNCKFELLDVPRMLVSGSQVKDVPVSK